MLTNEKIDSNLTTGLDAYDSTADQLNVILYQVGGKYQIHHDTSTKSGVSLSYRIATWINYLSDVEAGGATVFPKLNVSVWPEKGSAVFWFNMISNTAINKDLVHSGCPVLYGTKWIATKWIREWLDA